MDALEFATFLRYNFSRFEVFLEKGRLRSHLRPLMRDFGG
jgi:hypothetical protein